MDEILKLILQTAIMALVPTIVAMAIQTLRRLHIQLSAEQEARLDAAVRRAILEAEEWAAGRLKSKLPVTSYQKLSRAVEQVTPAFDLTPEQAEARVKAALPELGLGASANFSRPLAGSGSAQP
jgi:hypothetical protein